MPKPVSRLRSVGRLRSARRGSWVHRSGRIGRSFARVVRVRRFLMSCLISVVLSGFPACAPRPVRTAGINRPPRSTLETTGPRFAPRAGQPRPSQGAASGVTTDPADDEARPTGTSYSPSFDARVPESNNSSTASALSYERSRDLDLAVVTSNATRRTPGTTVANTAVVIAAAAAIASLIGWVALSRRRRTHA